MFKHLFQCIQFFGEMRIGHDDGVAVSGQRVHRIAALDVDQMQLVFASEIQKDTGHQIICRGEAFVDVFAGVTSGEAADTDPQTLSHISRHRLPFQGELHAKACAGTAAYHDLILGGAVDIDHPACGKQSRIDVRCSGKAVALTRGDQNLQRRVSQSRCLQRGEAHSNTNSVIGSQGSAPCHEPSSITYQGDGIRPEIMIRIRRHLTVHIHMGLKDHRRRLLIADAGRLLHDDIMIVILYYVQTMLLGPVIQVVTDRFLISGASGNLRDLLEDPQGQTVRFLSKNLIHVPYAPYISLFLS